MKPSDKVRHHCKTTYVDPARQKGLQYVTIRSGDLHSDLRYKNRFPLVCAAIGSNMFEEMCWLKRKSIDGPLNGANTIFTFELL